MVGSVDCAATPIDRQYVAPDPRSPSVDHVVAGAVGGADTRANVQITDLFCNMDRRDSGRTGTLKEPIIIHGPNGLTITVDGSRRLPPRTPEEARARLAARIARAERRQCPT
jgi:hypothetical protein